MPKVIDVFGEHEAALYECGCIDKRTLNNIEDSLKILYNDHYRQRETELEHGESTSVTDLVLKRTESLQNAVKSINICEDFIEIPPIKKRCECKHHINLDKISSDLLKDIELFKDLSYGKQRIRKSRTPIDVMARIENTAKDIIIQKNQYDRCCNPEQPTIKKESIRGESFIETMDKIQKIVKTAEK